eukprot:GHVN01020402.1.p1 GENE.GHVN01020402.1~~GHVN01020402.1.p1  ORF type:complete len:241 (-),score=64.38 GHVN01020402.1:861-1559(-)
MNYLASTDPQFTNLTHHPPSRLHDVTSGEGLTQFNSSVPLKDDWVPVFSESKVSKLLKLINTGDCQTVDRCGRQQVDLQTDMILETIEAEMKIVEDHNSVNQELIENIISNSLKLKNGSDSMRDPATTEAHEQLDIFTDDGYRYVENILKGLNKLSEVITTHPQAWGGCLSQEVTQLTEVVARSLRLSPVLFPSPLIDFTLTLALMRFHALTPTEMANVAVCVMTIDRCGVT